MKIPRGPVMIASTSAFSSWLKCQPAASALATSCSGVLTPAITLPTIGFAISQAMASSPTVRSLALLNNSSLSRVR